MAVGSVEEYLAVLEKSKLLRSDQFLEAQRLAKEIKDPATLAKVLARENLVSRWQAAVVLAGSSSLFLGKYKLIQLLGRGGMGSVFLAEHVTMNRRVALKVVPREVANDRSSLERFFAEARAIAALDHPNIVQAYSVDNDRDRYFIVMEFVDGMDLQRIVEEQGPLDFDRAADFVRQAAEGLAHAHNKKLVHCDIKPSNLLVNNQGVVKILDLGLVRLRGASGGATPGEPALGTVDYQAPEQGLETADFDHRADIYSLGCTLYFLLTGHPPFPEGSLAQRIVKHQTQEPRGITEDRPDAPPPLVDICRKMMAKDPAGRYQSCEDVSAALLALRPAGRSAAPANPLKLVKAADDELPVIAAAAAAMVGKTAAGGVGEGQPVRAAGILGAVGQKLNTPGRKIIAGVVAGVVLLTAIAGASLPFLLGRSKPVTEVAAEVKPDDDAWAKKDDDADKKKAADDKDKEAKDKEAKDKAAADDDPGNQEMKRVKPKKKTDPDKSDEKKPEEKKPDEKPATPPKPVPPPAPPKVVISLEGLAKDLNVPYVGPRAANDQEKTGNPTDPLVIGKVQTDANTKVEIKLIGGETITKGSPGNLKFAIQPAEGKTEDWNIVAESKTKDPATIARVWREGDNLTFQWREEAAERGYNLLRYCGLAVTCGDKTRFIALSKPHKAAPLVVNLVQGKSMVTLKHEGLPDASLLRLQVFAPDKNIFPKPDLEVMETKARDAKTSGGKGGRGRATAEMVAGDTIAAKGRLAIGLTKEKTPRCGFRVTFDTKGNQVLVGMDAVCDINGQMAPFNRASVVQAESMAQSFEAAKAGGGKSKSKSKTQANPGMEASMKTLKEQIGALKTLGGELDGKGKIFYRVYVLLTKPDESPACDVTIFQAGEGDDAKPVGEQKPEPKAKKK